MNALEVQSIEKWFPTASGEDKLFLQVDHLSVATGEQLALRGASGCGKTTLLHVIAGIVAADAGRIVVAGKEMPRAWEAERDRLRASSIGYVFQSFNLLGAYTALENVALGMSFCGRVDIERAVDLLERMGLGARLHNRPSQLSVGQQQRVAIARAIAARPSLVLADEPTGNLDPVAAQTAVRLIREVCRESGAALLLVSHDERILGHFDRCLDLADLNRAYRDPGEEELDDRAVGAGA